MTNNPVVIVDYGLGNIFSVTRAVEQCGGSGELTSDPTRIRTARRLILPGVGAFENGMAGLRERGLIDPIRECVDGGGLLLGICLGMQMLVDSSEEFGLHAGLGLIPGRVVPIEARDEAGHRLKTPHIGWSGLRRPFRSTSWDGTILDGIEEGTSAYFVHSFSVIPDRDEHRLADTAYGDFPIAAAIQRDNVIGCQFHPEKSAHAGLRMMQAFLKM